MVPTRCLNSAERLPLFDSSMFMTLVFVPRMLNFRDLERGKSVADRALSERTCGRTFARVKSRSKRKENKTKNIALTPEVLQHPRSP